MKPSAFETNELLKKFARSASWLRLFFETSDAGEIDQIISGLSPLDLVMLDHRVRGHGQYNYYNLNNWQNFKAADINRLAESKFPTSLVGLASFHSNGYVRQTAVIELASHRSGKELPFLLIRLNDWVSQVRDAAAQAVRMRMEPAYALHFLANISLVFRLRACGRVDQQFVDDICNLLKGPECKDALQAGMTSQNKLIRRTCFQLASEADPATRTAIIRAVMNDSDSTIRSWAVRHLLPEVTPDELPGLVEPMLKDSFMPIQRDALWFLAKKRPDLATKPVLIALLDNHASMRETARHFLAITDIKDIRAFYASALEGGEKKQCFAAICGLSETGSKTDLKLIIPFLHSKLTKIRRAAIYAIGKLDVEGQLETLVLCLSDEKPSVSREATRVLLSKAHSIALADLEHLFANGTSFHIRRNALTLIGHTEKWKKLPALLQACADREIRLSKQAAEALRDWRHNYNSSFAEPTKDDFIRIQAALVRFEKALSYGIAENLRDCLKSYFK